MSTAMCDVSVIVPIYNAEPFIQRCVESVLAQSVPVSEILLINDGSTDGSLDICNACALSDSRIKVINKKNAGVSEARNTGIDMASGKYLMFLDADDWLAPDAIESCLPYVATYDIVRFSANVVFRDRTEKYDLGAGETYADIIKMIIARKTIVGCWGALFRRELFENLRFDRSFAVGEDWLMTAQLAKRCRNIKLLPDCYCYFYNKMNDQSCTSNINPAKMVDQFKVLLLIRDIFPSGYHLQLAYSKTMLVLEAIYGFGVAKTWGMLNQAGDSFGFADLARAIEEKIGSKAKRRLFRLWIYDLYRSFISAMAS